MSFLHGISWDALFGIAGLIAGSWMFAELGMDKTNDRELGRPRQDTLWRRLL
jgi:hypothetical protein